MTRGGKQQRQLIDGDASSSSSSSSSVSPTSSTSFAWNSGAVDNNNNNNVSRSRDHLLQAFRNDACRRIFPIPFPNFTFVTNTLSFLYTKDLRLREARIVPTEKVFCLRVSVESMKYLKNQSKMVTASMLDTPFLFIERHDDDDDSIGGEGGGGKRRREEVDAYCLSYPGWDPSSAAANNVDADCVFPSLSIDDLSDNAFMRRIEDEEIVWQAYQAFLLCPMVNMICEYKGTAEEQQEHALSCCTAAVEKLMQTKQDVDFEAEMDELLGNDAYFVCKKDSRQVVLLHSLSARTFCHSSRGYSFLVQKSLVPLGLYAGYILRAVWKRRR
jgi:hypothetical protein